ncbi:hypothetical protein EDC01DRAFT_670629 [Geopyxis carbonaria]|nr:hypothetical protein EDC01DRAFT_670629 [Geopyxis carbonaria]
MRFSLSLLALYAAAAAATATPDLEERAPVPVDSITGDPCAGRDHAGKALCAGCYTPATYCLPDSQSGRIVVAKATRSGYQCPVGHRKHNAPVNLCVDALGPSKQKPIILITTVLGLGGKKVPIPNQCCKPRAKQSLQRRAVAEDDEYLDFDVYYDEETGLEYYEDEDGYTWAAPPLWDDDSADGDDAEIIDDEVYYDGDIDFDAEMLELGSSAYDWYFDDGDSTGLEPEAATANSTSAGNSTESTGGSNSTSNATTTSNRTTGPTPTSSTQPEETSVSAAVRRDVGFAAMLAAVGAVVGVFA